MEEKTIVGIASAAGGGIGYSCKWIRINEDCCSDFLRENLITKKMKH